MQVVNSTILSTELRWVGLFNKFTLRYKVDVLSWDPDDSTDSMYPFDNLSDRIQARFALEYPQYCFLVQQTTGSLASSLSNSKWIPCRRYTVTQNKEEVKQFKLHEEKKIRSMSLKSWFFNWKW
jgi:hypothetical protein